MDSLDFFRRNLKPIMAALTLMAMITFVFDDSMRAGNTTLVPIILTILFGGLIMMLFRAIASDRLAFEGPRRRRPLLTVEEAVRWRPE